MHQWQATVGTTLRVPHLCQESQTEWIPQTIKYTRMLLWQRCYYHCLPLNHQPPSIENRFRAEKGKRKEVPSLLTNELFVRILKWVEKLDFSIAEACTQSRGLCVDCRNKPWQVPPVIPVQLLRNLVWIWRGEEIVFVRQQSAKSWRPKWGCFYWLLSVWLANIQLEQARPGEL